MAASKIILQTTDVPASRSIGEVMATLVEMGARAIVQDYSVDGRITGITFILNLRGTEYGYKLPLRTDAIFQLLRAQRKRVYRDSEQQYREQQDREQAERIAWRQMLLWCRAQLAMKQTGMVRTEEVFLPYLQNGKQSFFEAWAEKQKALPAPEQVK